MTRIDYIIVGLLAALWATAKKTRTPTASVDFETPTVSGSGSEEFGGTDYATSDTLL